MTFYDCYNMMKNVSAARVTCLFFMCVIGAWIAISCSRVQDIYIDAGAGIYQYNVIRTEVTAEQAKLAFKVAGGVYRTAGVIHADDAQQLAARIAAKDTVSDTHLANEIFTVTLIRSLGKQQVHYAFFVDAGDGLLVFSDVRSITFTPFALTIVGIAEDGIVTSLYQDGHDPGNGTNVDFFMLLEQQVVSPEALALTIGETNVPLNYVSLEGSHGTVYVSIPDHVLAGQYEMTLRYRSEIRYQQEITIPAGRIRKAAQHPRNRRSAHAFFVYQGKLHTGTFISPGFFDNSVEYASWDPKTGQWAFKDFTDLTKHIWSYNPGSPGGFDDNIGYAIKDKVYFTPAVVPLHDEAANRHFQEVTMSVFDPNRYTWDTHHLFNKPDEWRGYGAYVAFNVQPWNEDLYFAFSPADDNQITGPITLHKYTPSRLAHERVATLDLPSGTGHVTLVAGPDQMYLLAYERAVLDFWRQYRVHLYTVQLETGTLTLLSERMTKEQSGYTIVHGGRICVFGGGFYADHGEVYDLATQTWAYINPTYANFGYPLNNKMGFLGVIGGKIYNAYGHDRGNNDGVILEWDIDYRK